MKALIALTNHNIDFVVNALSKAKNLPAFSLFDIDTVMDAASDAQHILLVPTVQTLKRNAQVLNKCPNTVVMVFDAPVLCKELGATMLDIEKQTLDYVFRYHHLEHRDIVHAVRTAFAAEGDFTLTRKRVDMSTKLLKRTYGSVIAAFLTFIYKIPDTDRRAAIQKAVFDAWWTGGAEAVATYIEGQYKRNVAAATFVESVRSSVGQGFAAAVAEIRRLREAGKPIAYAKLSKTHKISAFDLRYYSKGRK